jgi:MFS family permease
MRKKLYYGWVVAFAAFVMFFVIGGAGIAPLSLYTVPVSEALGVSRSAYSLVTTIAALTIFVGSMLFGPLQEKLGLKNMTTIGLSFAAISCVTFSFSKSIVLFYISGFLFGIGYTFTATTMCAAIISNWFVKRKGIIMGFIMSAPSAGAMVLLPLISSWIRDYGYNRSFLISAFVMVGALVLALIFIRSKPSDVGLEPYGAGEVTTNEGVKKESKQETLDGLNRKQAIKTVNFWLLVIAGLFLGLSLPAFQAILPPYLSDRGLDIVVVGSIIGLAAVFNTISNIGMGFIHDKFGINVVNVLGIALFVASVLLVILSQAMVVIWVSAILFGLGLVMASLPLPLMVGKVFGTKNMGAIMGIIFGISFFGYAIGPPLGNVLYEVTGTYVTAFISQIVMAILALVFFFLSLKIKIKAIEESTETAPLQ